MPKAIALHSTASHFYCKAKGKREEAAPNISWRCVGEITAFLKLFPRIIWLGACRALPAPRPPPQHRVRRLGSGDRVEGPGTAGKTAGLDRTCWVGLEIGCDSERILFFAIGGKRATS